MVDLISEMIPVNFQTPPVSIPRSFIDINQQESMKNYKVSHYEKPCVSHFQIP